MTPLRRIRGGGEFVPDVVHAAPRRGNNVVVLGEIAHKELFGGPCLRVRPAVGHRLAATSLVEWVVDFDAEALQQLQSGLADFGIEHVDEARNHQSHTHGCSPAARSKYLDWPINSRPLRGGGLTPNTFRRGEGKRIGATA